MIEVVINYDQAKGMYKVYEPTTDTLLVTTSLSETFLKLSEFLKSAGLITEDILKSGNINYHIDSSTFIAMIESNVSLMKRLASGPSGFTMAGQKFGSTTTAQPDYSKRGGVGKLGKPKSTGMFSKSGFNQANKKFGNQQ